jgi:hypothetical protein
MKKIYYLFAWVAAAMTFVACHPLDKTYKALDGLPKAAKQFNYTLQTTDYALLPATVPAKTSLAFASLADANINVPTILNSKFFDYGDGSAANVTFTIAAPASKIVLADSVFKDVSYTLTNADYLLLPGNKYDDFSVAQVLSWLPYKYPTPAANQLAVLNFTIYPATTTPAPPYSFLYLNGAWQQIYMITPAQYALVNRSAYNQFTSADDANLTSYLNGILKADISLMAAAKVGDVQYVSFNYYNSSVTPKVTSQRVIPLYFNGTNWGSGTTSTGTLPFGKIKGVWIADQTVYYTISAADVKLISSSTIGGDANANQRADLAKYGDFSGWAAADIQSAMILALSTNFPPSIVKTNVDYKITYLLYSGKDVPTTLTFQYNGSAWVSK